MHSVCIAHTQKNTSAKTIDLLIYEHWKEEEEKTLSKGELKECIVYIKNEKNFKEDKEFLSERTCKQFLLDVISSSQKIDFPFVFVL